MKPWWQRRGLSKQEGLERMALARAVADGRLTTEQAHEQLDQLEKRYGVPTNRRRYLMTPEGAKLL